VANGQQGYESLIKVEQDFKSGKRLMVKDGLSLTEARQCALYSILNT